MCAPVTETCAAQVDAVMETRPLYSITLTAAINCADDDKIKPPVSKQSAQKLMRTFVAKGRLLPPPTPPRMLTPPSHTGWLELSSKLRVTLAMRSLQELAVYLKDTYSAPDDEEDDMAPDDRLWVSCEQCGNLVTHVRLRRPLSPSSRLTLSHAGVELPD